MYQYYEVNDAGKRIYIKTKDKIKAKKAIQKNYLESVRKVILTQRYRIERFLKLYDPDAIENVFEELCEARKVMVDPLIVLLKDGKMNILVAKIPFRNKVNMLPTMKS